MRRSILIIFLSIISFSNITYAQLANSAWPMRGQNPQHTGRGITNVSASSTLKWKYQTGGPVQSSPSIYTDGTVYFGSDENYFYAIKPDGTLKWKYQTGGGVFSSPAIGSDGTAYVGSYDTYLYAIKSDGTLKWKYQTGSYVFSSPAIGSDGTVYVSSWDNFLYAINSDGTLKWKYQAGVSLNSSPAISADGTIYFGSDDNYLYALNFDGTLKWKYLTGGNVGSSPAVGLDGIVYVGSWDNYIYAINTGGTLKWKYQTTDMIDTCPSLGLDGTVYVGSYDDYFYAINSDGTLKWKYLTGGNVFASSAIGIDGTVYVGSWDAYFYAINPNGTLKWKYQTASQITSSPAIGSDGTVYVGSYDNYLYAFAPETTSVSLTSPNGGETWTAGASKNITWTSSNVSNVKLEYSTNNGSTWITIISNTSASSGSYTWTIPSTPSINCKFRISDATNSSVNDTSNSVFTIENPPTLANSAWPMRGQNQQHTGRGVSTFSASNILQWERTFPSTIIYSPSIGNDGTVYVGSDTPYIYAIKSGQQIWSFKVREGSINCTPAIGSDGTIYFGNYYDFYALKPDGTLKWNYEYIQGGSSSPAIGNDGIVYIGANDSNLYAINYDGTLKWKYLTGAQIGSSPAIGVDGTIYVGSHDNYLYAINVDGTLKWKYQTSGFVSSSPAIDLNGTIYVGSSDNYFYSINPNGTLRWKYQTGGIIQSSPAIGVDGTIFVASNDNCLYAINIDGSLRWKYQTGSSSQAIASSSPVIGAGNVIYLNANDGYLYAIKSDGALKWKYLSGGNKYCSSIAIGSDGSLYFGNFKDSSFSGYLCSLAPEQISIAITSPNGGESWTAGTTQNITWSSSGVTNVKLEYSTNNGSTWTTIIASTPATAGTYSWTVPNVTSSQCIVRISDASNALVNDQSNAAFTIATTKSVVVASPNGAENLTASSQTNIRWTSSGVSNVKIEYSANNGSSWTTIVESTTSDGEFNWTIPKITSSNCLIRISDVSNSAINDLSNAIFSITTPKSVTVTSPNGGESWITGSSHNITWTHQNLTAVKIEYSSNNGSTWNSIIESYDASVGSYALTIPNAPSTNCLVRISDATDSQTNDISNVAFTIYSTPSINESSLFVIDTDLANAGFQTSSPILGIGPNQTVGFGIFVGKVNPLRNFNIDVKWDGALADLSTKSTTSIVADDVTINGKVITLGETANILDDPQLGPNEVKETGHYYGNYAKFGGDEIISDNYGLLYFFVLKTKATFTTSDKLVVSVKTTIGWTTGGVGANDLGEKYFYINTGDNISLISPNGTELYTTGTPHNITWASSGIDKIKIEYTKDNGVTWSLIVAEITASTGNYSWTVPNTLSTNCKVRISDVSNPTINDTSDSIFTIASAPTLANSAWPMFGQNPQHTGRGLAPIALNNKLSWKFQTGGYLRSSPIIGNDGTLYIGSDDKYLYAINSDGTLKWKFLTLSSVASTPTIDSEGNLYFGSDDDNIYSVDLNGSLRWKFITGGTVSCSPVLGQDGILYIGSDDKYLYALNHDGTLKWKFLIGDYISSSPAISIDGTIFIGCFGKYLYAVNPDGTLKWKFLTDSSISSSPAIGIDGSIYVGCDDKFLYAINSNGSLKWKFETSSNIHHASPAIDTEGSIFIGSYDGNLNAVNPNGTLKWKFKTGGAIWASPAIDTSGNVCIGSDDKSFYCVNSDGTLRWKYQTDRNIFSSPVIGPNGTMYIGSSDGYLYAFSPANPSLTLTSPNGGESYTAGSSHNITWTSRDIENIKLEYSTDNGTNCNLITSTTSATSGTYSWIIPNAQSGNCLIKISSSTNGSLNDESDAPFTILSAPVITVTAPNGGETVKSGDSFNISWTSSNVTNVKIEYSINNGTSWSTIVASTLSDGSYSWVIPDVSSSNCLIRISDAVNSTTNDISDTKFIIVKPVLTVSSPNGGESYIAGSVQTIVWSSMGLDKIQIEYTSDNGVNWSQIAAEISASTGNYSWTVPNVNSALCKIKIINTTDNSIFDLSDSAFRISTPVITVTSPNGGEILYSGGTKNITWTSNGVSNIKIEYSTDNGINWIQIIGNVISSSGTYSWPVPVEESSKCIIKITSTDNGQITDSCNTVFSIDIPQITISSPNGGESLITNSQRTITWTYKGIDKVKLEYSPDNGINWTQIATGINSSLGSYLWTIPQINSNNCLIRASDTLNIVSDTSDNTFTIIKKELRVVSPNGGSTCIYGNPVLVNWTCSAIDKIKLEYSSDHGATWIQVDTNITSSDESYSWDIPNIKSSQCLIRLSDTSNPSVYDVSDDVFTITPPFVIVTSPDGIIKWRAGTTKNITWTSLGVENVKISCSYNNGVTWNTVNESVSASAETYSWSLPEISSDNCLIKIADSVKPDLSDQCDTIFSITMPEINITTTSINFGTIPVGNEKAETFIIENKGNCVLSVENIHCDNSNYTVELSSIDIEPHQSQTITVKFKPDSSGIILGIITVLNDDSDENGVTFSVKGTSYTACSVAVNTPVSEITTDATITYTITNPDNDTVNLACEFSTDNGLTWRNATIEGKTIGINQDGYHSSFVWKGTTDLSGYDGMVNFRVTPSNIMAGLPATKEIIIDYNEPPSIQVYTPEGGHSGTVSIKYDLYDAENDNIGLDVEYSLNGVTYNKTAGSNGKNIVPGNNKIALWDSFKDFGYIYNKNIYLRLTPSDNDNGLTYTIGPFKLTNLVADYNFDLKINGDDLLAFSDAWYLQDKNKEIGPVSGDIPDLTVIRDNKINFEDLSVFAWMWNWSTSNPLPAKIIQKPTSELSENSLIYPVLLDNGKVELFSAKTLNFVSFEINFGDINCEAAILPSEFWDKDGKGISLQRVNKEGSIEFAAARFGRDSVISNNTFKVAGISFGQESNSDDIMIYYKARVSGENTIYSGSCKISKDLIITKPQEITLSQNIPNPFNPTTTIEYSVPRDTHLKLVVYNSSGQEVAILKDSFSKSGRYSVVWDAKGMPSGIYIYKLLAEDKVDTKKMLLMK